MFGRNKVSQEEVEEQKKRAELDEQLFSRLEESRELFSADVEEIEESYRQVEADVRQVKENMKSAASLAEENTRVEAALIHSLNECGERLKSEEDRQQEVLQQFRNISDETTRLVDENKHFTTPSKYLTEFSAHLREQNRSYLASLDQMSDYGKQMGVLALNAAIEAGRMGESGKQFVTAAEDIRSYASNYDKEILNVRTQLEESEHRIAELEEQVKHLVKHLKDSNVSTAKLMKSCGELVRRTENEVDRGISEEVTALKNQVTILKNADEEIIKSEERNRMQMDDLTEEFTSQQQNQKEMFQLMDPVFRHVVERK